MKNKKECYACHPTDHRFRTEPPHHPSIIERVRRPSVLLLTKKAWMRNKGASCRSLADDEILNLRHEMSWLEKSQFLLLLLLLFLWGNDRKLLSASLSAPNFIKDTRRSRAAPTYSLLKKGRRRVMEKRGRRRRRRRAYKYPRVCFPWSRFQHARRKQPARNCCCFCCCYCTSVFFPHALFFRIFPFPLLISRLKSMQCNVYITPYSTDRYNSIQRPRTARALDDWITTKEMRDVTDCDSFCSTTKERDIVSPCSINNFQ